MSKRLRLSLMLLTVLVVAVFVGRSILLYSEQKALDEERKAFSERLRASAKASADQQRQQPIILPANPLSPFPGDSTELVSDQEELAQIQRWQQTPVKERSKLIDSESPQSP